jgi:hypothetical protein
MAGRDPYDYDDEQTPWYNRTPNVIGASVAGLAVIGILIAAVIFATGQVNEPTQAPLYYVEPSFSATATRSSSTPTTTATITSTSPPVTTDINGPTPTSSSDTSSSSEPSTSDTAWTSPPPGWSQDESPSATRRGPRTNVTRTLYPQP